MPQNMLSAKLSELDEQFERLHESIRTIETVGAENISTELAKLRLEFEKKEAALIDKLRFSRAGVVAGLSKAYQQIEKIAGQARKELENSADGRQDEERSIEEKLLFAEYSMDFAMQAANRALLVSMEAMEEQMKQQKKERNAE